MFFTLFDCFLERDLPYLPAFEQILSCGYNASEYFRRHDSDASCHPFPYHHLAGSCRSRFLHCTLCRHSARPRKIWPRHLERLYFGHHVSKPYGQRPRGHGDCGPGVSPAFHLRGCPCDLPEGATRNQHRSILLKLHSNRCEGDRSLLRRLCCQRRSRLSDILWVFWQCRPLSILQDCVLRSRWPGRLRIWSGHHVCCMFFRMWLMRSLGEYAHWVYQAVKVAVQRSALSRAVSRNEREREREN